MARIRRADPPLTLRGTHRVEARNTSRSEALRVERRWSQSDAAVRTVLVPRVSSSKIPQNRERSFVKLEDRQTTAATEVEARGPQGATASFASEDLDPGRERRPLESYFQEIGGTRTLRREEEVVPRQGAGGRDGGPPGRALLESRCSSRHVVDALGRPARSLAHRGEALRVDGRRGNRRDRGARRACREETARASRRARPPPEATRHPGGCAQRRKDRRRTRARAALAGRPRRAARARLRNRQADARRPQGQQPAE